MIKSFAYSLITKLFVGLINFAILILSSRYLGVASRGEISIFLLNIIFIQVINEVYTGYSIVHFIPKFNWRKIIGAGIVYTVLFCSLSNAVIILINRQIPGYEFSGYILSLLIILNTFNCVLILGKQNIRAYNFLCFLQPFLLLLGILLAVFGYKFYTFEAYFYPLLISFTLSFLVSLTILYKSGSKDDQLPEFSLRPILISGLMYQMSLWMFIFCNRFSYYLLPDKVSVGLYSSASSLVESVLIISNGLSPVLLAKVANNEKTLSNARTILSIAKMAFLFSALALLIMCSVSENFLTAVLGKGFTGIRSVIRLYGPGVMLAGFFTVLKDYFMASGMQRIVLGCYGAGFLLSLCISPFLVRNYGITGAAYTADLAYLVIAISITFAFLAGNKLSLTSIFSFKGDYDRIRSLFQPKQN